MDNDLFFIFILKTNDKQCMLLISCFISFKTEVIRSYFLCCKYFLQEVFHFTYERNETKRSNRSKEERIDLSR